MEIAFSQEIYFSNEDRIPINDVAKSLLALEIVSRNSPILNGEHAKPGEANVIFNKTVEIILVFHHLTGC